MSKFQKNINNKLCIVRNGVELVLGARAGTVIFLTAPGGIVGEISVEDDRDKYWNITETMRYSSTDVLAVGGVIDVDGASYFVLDAGVVDEDGTTPYIVGR